MNWKSIPRTGSCIGEAAFTECDACPCSLIFAANCHQHNHKGFLALTCLLGPSDEHIKSLQLLDTGKVVNLHKFKMAAVQSFNLQITFAPTAISPEPVGRLTSLSARWIANSISYQAITLTITVQVSALRAAKVKKWWSKGVFGQKVMFTPTMPLQSKKDNFLLNSDNKQNCID